MEKDYSDSSGQEINLSEILRSLWASKLLIISITFLFALSSVIYAIKTPDKFTSTAILQVQSGTNNSNSSMSQFSGIASLAGISLPSGNTNKSYYVIETIKSRDFVKHLNSFDDISENLIAAVGYDSSKEKTLFDEKLFDVNSKTWVRDPSPERQKIPTYLEVHEKFIEQVDVSMDKKSGYLKISFEHFSPNFSYNFVNLIINELNIVTREKDISESQAALDYLLNQLSSTEVANVRNSISLLINNQLEKLMLANVKEDYLISTIDAPFIPEINSYPNRPFIAIFGTLLGALLSIFFVLIRYYLNKRKR